MVVLVLVLPFSVVSQEIENLVLNPGFEDIDTCLNRLSTFGYGSNDNQFMKAWDVIFDVGDPGYVSSCYNPTIGNPASIPNTPFGYQTARDEGSNFFFSGSFMIDENLIFKSFGANSSEKYIFKEPFTGSFKESLSKGNYYFEFYVNFPGSNNRLISTDAFDIILHDNKAMIPLAEKPFVNAQDIVWSNMSGNIITDSINWTKLSGCFIANGGENFFSIGAFRDTSLINYVRYSNNEPNYFAAYYYDDFLIYQCDTCCPDQYPVQDYITVNNTLLQQGDPVYFETFLNKGNTANLYLFDSAGRIVYQHYLSGTDNTHQIPISLAAGIYHYAMVTSEKKKLGGKIVVL